VPDDLRAVLRQHEPYEGPGGEMECSCNAPLREGFDYIDHIVDVMTDVKVARRA
jgi:hypothetical protein